MALSICIAKVCILCNALCLAFGLASMAAADLVLLSSVYLLLGQVGVVGISLQQQAASLSPSVLPNISMPEPVCGQRCMTMSVQAGLEPQQAGLLLPACTAAASSTVLSQ